MTSKKSSTERPAAQSELGKLRVSLVDPGGLPVSGTVELVSEANQYVRKFSTNADVRSAIPKEVTLKLGLKQLETTVNVNDNAQLVNPGDMSGAKQIGSPTLQDRLTAMPGRSLAELVTQEPGWVFRPHPLASLKASAD